VNALQPLAIGAALAIGVSAYAKWIGFDRDRAFYPTVLVVVASYYLLFSAMAGGTSSMLPELLLASIFIVAASLGFKRNMWLVAAALAAHAILDAFHGSLVLNPGVPRWWPPFCAAYDLTAAAFLAISLHRAPAPSKVRTGITAPGNS
jgi:hypothetical protein